MIPPVMLNESTTKGTLLVYWYFDTEILVENMSATKRGGEGREEWRRIVACFLSHEETIIILLQKLP